MNTDKEFIFGGGRYLSYFSLPIAIHVETMRRMILYPILSIST